MKRYTANIATVVEGTPMRVGDGIRLTEDEAAPYLKDKRISEDGAGLDGDEMTDVAPSAKPSMVTSTKRSVPAEKAADKKAAEAEEK